MDYLSYGISKSEYEKIISLLGKEPSRIELALFSAMWSEHCSYKSSKKHLKKLFSKSPRVITGFGENAGVIDLYEGERVAFKMESHNHPSKIEPFHGSMTGVGGILRDIFAMNARPIALANYLCFGEKNYHLTKSLLKGVSRGIGGYGNCIGIPTVTGHTEFDPSYNENILVNAFALGVYGPNDKVMTSKNTEVGAWIVYVGAETGRDGIHGASMASESFSEDKENKQSTVQVGDPFYGKLIMEGCLEVMRSDLVLAAQDMGAAGLISSSFEMASKAELGMALNLDKVPLRDSTMTPEDILLSESQERMLLICSPDKYPSIKKTFENIHLPCVVIGEVIENCEVQLQWKGKQIACIDPRILTDKAPEYDRPYEHWSHSNKVDKKEQTCFKVPDANSHLLRILKSAQGCSKEFIYNQYDQRVGSSTARDCSFPIGVIRLPFSNRFLGIALGGRSHILKTDAALGGQDSIAYPTIQLACYGFESLAVTDCLNFGNPEKKEIMSEFVASVEGMSEACRAFKSPLISGNVSFYNEFSDQNIIPTTATGLVGLNPKTDGLLPMSYFQKKKEAIYLIYLHQSSVSGMSSQLLGENLCYEGELDLDKINKWLHHLICISNEKEIQSIRMVGKFGLSYTLSRMTIPKGIGAKISSSLDPFQERLYEIVMTADVSEKKIFENKLQQLSLDYIELGETGSSSLSYNKDIKLDVKDIKRSYFESLVE